MTDFPALAAAIAAQLDGTIRPSGDNADDAPAGRDIAWIDLQNERAGLRVVLRVGMGSESTRVRAVMSQTMESRGGADYRSTPDFYKLETAAAMSRGADIIARQIEAKIVQPALPMLEAWNAKRAEMAAHDARLVATVMRWREMFPTANIGKAREDSTDAEFRLHNRSSSEFIHGRLGADGRLYVDRMSTLSAEMAIKLVEFIAHN